MGLIWLALVVLTIVVRLPRLVVDSGERAIAAVPAVARGLTMSAADRITKSSAITTAFVAAVRGALPGDGRLVLYSPYAGAGFEFILRLQFERTKNLLYPDPRDVHFARNADELRGKIEPDVESKLLVVDFTQEPSPLTIGGDYELVFEEPIGGVGRLRVWRLLRAR